MKIYGDLKLADKIALATVRSHKSIYKEDVETVYPRVIVIQDSTKLDTGEATQVTVFIDQDGVCWDTISPTVAEMMSKVIDICEDEGVEIEQVNFHKELSSKKREFLVCEPVFRGVD